MVEPPDASGGRIAIVVADVQLDLAHRQAEVSAATCVMMVRVPVPRSWVPISTINRAVGIDGRVRPCWRGPRRPRY